MLVSQLLLSMFTHDDYFSVYLLSVHEASLYTQIEFLRARDYVTEHAQCV